MRVAFFSDIHGNLPALQTAYADARDRAVQGFYCAGDLIGYGPYPSEVCRFVRDHSFVTIKGNYDAKVIEAINNYKYLKENLKPGKWKILNWTRKRISTEIRTYLESLPEIWREELPGGLKLLMAHGSPISPSDTIYPSVTDHALIKFLDGEEPHILVVGHTHIPFVARIGRMLVINCGSLGQPVDGDPRGAYAIGTIESGSLARAEIIRFDYPMDDIIQALRCNELPAYLASDLREGKKRRELP